MTGKIQCRSLTQLGKRCCWNVPDKNVLCKSHQKQCKRIIRSYKSVCNKVWNVKCVSGMTNLQLQKIHKDAKECLEKRYFFSNECCRGETDRSHCGAMVKMNRVVTDCEKELLSRN